MPPILPDREASICPVIRLVGMPTRGSQRCDDAQRDEHFATNKLPYALQEDETKSTAKSLTNLGLSGIMLMLNKQKIRPRACSLRCIKSGV